VAEGEHQALTHLNKIMVDLNFFKYLQTNMHKLNKTHQIGRVRKSFWWRTCGRPPLPLHEDRAAPLLILVASTCLHRTPALQGFEPGIVLLPPPALPLHHLVRRWSGRKVAHGG
jgi:hypothetical protein